MSALSACSFYHYQLLHVVTALSVQSMPVVLPRVGHSYKGSWQLSPFDDGDHVVIHNVCLGTLQITDTVCTNIAASLQAAGVRPWRGMRSCSLLLTPLTMFSFTDAYAPHPRLSHTFKAHHHTSADDQVRQAMRMHRRTTTSLMWTDGPAVNCESNRSRHAACTPTSIHLGPQQSTWVLRSPAG
jgi:hypothetical protein